jgi:sugar lactone lactonase YvrE
MRTALLLLTAVLSLAWDRGRAETFARLPPGSANPEGLTVDDHGNVFVADFAVHGTPTGMGQVIVFDEDGRLLRVLNLPGSSTLLLGLDFHPLTHDLLVIDFGSKRVVRVDPLTGANTVFTNIPGGSGPNGLTFDAAGNVYVSDSFQGIIWKTGPAGGPAVNWAQDKLLATTGLPPFGANGIEFNNAKDAMFVANTGDDSIIRIPVAGGKAGKAELFTTGVNGADGLILDEDDNLWVCANQADEIVVVDKTGKVIAKLGDFGGISESGEPVGLLFPASPKFHGDHLVVTNLALDTRLFGFNAVDAQWAAQVRTHTVAKVPRRIPGMRHSHDD